MPPRGRGHCRASGPPPAPATRSSPELERAAPPQAGRHQCAPSSSAAPAPRRQARGPPREPLAVPATQPCRPGGVAVSRLRRRGGDGDFTAREDVRAPTRLKPRWRATSWRSGVPRRRAGTPSAGSPRAVLTARTPTKTCNSGTVTRLRQPFRRSRYGGAVAGTPTIVVGPARPTCRPPRCWPARRAHRGARARLRSPQLAEARRPAPTSTPGATSPTCPGTSVRAPARPWWPATAWSSTSRATPATTRSMCVPAWWCAGSARRLDGGWRVVQWTGTAPKCRSWWWQPATSTPRSCPSGRAATRSRAS